MNEDNFDRFVNLLEREREINELENTHDSLIFWYAVNALGLDPEDVRERIVKDCNAEGIDSILVDYENSKIIFVQCKTTTDFSKTGYQIPEGEIKQTTEGLRFLLKGNYKGKITPVLENLVDEYHDLEKKGFSTELLFISLKKKPDTSNHIEQFRAEFPPINVNFIDIDKLDDFFRNHYLYMTRSPPNQVSLEILSNVIRKDSPVKSRVFTCKGKELARIYEQYGESILQQNVRNLLTTRSKSINSHIRETAGDPQKSKNFWYFNNGITAICKEIQETASERTINIKHLQIINGAQTAYALHNSFSKGSLNDDVELVIKIIETPYNDFAENVTLYTNSQNPIKLRDLCSNDEIQTKLQRILESYGYFYERKRGEFETLYPTKNAKEEKWGNNYKNNLLSNETLAQSHLAFILNKPAEAKSGKSRIFSKDAGGFYYVIFNDEDELLSEKFLLSYSLLDFVKAKKKEYNKQYKEAKDQPEGEKNRIYSYDFLLHSEYFILNLFKDFLVNEGLILDNKESLMKWKRSIDNRDQKITEIYNKIVQEMKEFISEKRQDTSYYHNKFFKNERSITLVRSYLKNKHSFVEDLN